jgi:quercetin dioxygenase-like cupin family protein
LFDVKSDIKTYYFFLPKGSIFDVRKHKYIETMVCLEGKIQLHYNDKTKMLSSFTRFNIPEDMKHYGIAIENTYMLVTSRF